MAEKTDVGNRGKKPNEHTYNERRLGELQAEIERTRSDMHRTIDELQKKLSPYHLREEAETAFGRARDMTGSAGIKARKIGSQVTGAIKENPFPIFMAGAAIGWLIMRVRRGQRPQYEEAGRQGRQSYRRAAEMAGNTGGRVKEYAGRTREKMSRIGGKAAERASRLSRAARETMSGYGESVRRSVESYPLQTGFAALGLGFLAGFLIRGTRKKKRMTGEYGPEAQYRHGSVSEKAVEEAVEKAKTKESYNKPF